MTAINDKNVRYVGTNGFGWSLHLVHVALGHFDGEVAFCVTSDGHEMMVKDWQGVQPKSAEEVVDFDWVNVNYVEEWDEEGEDWDYLNYLKGLPLVGERYF